MEIRTHQASVAHVQSHTTVQPAVISPPGQGDGHVTPAPATGHSSESTFEVSNQGPVNLTGESAAAVAPGADRATGLRTPPMESQPGANLALDAQRFFETNQHKPEYQAATWTHEGAPNKPLADAVKADAMQYLESNPAVSAAADRMLTALGPELHPAKVDGWKVDFALAHYATEGRAKGASWGETKGAVDAMLDAPVANPPWAKGRTEAGPLVEVGTKGREGVTVGAPVSGGHHTVMVADGKNNTIDFCTNPYPSPTGVGDAVLGGTNNKGQVDLTGTIVIRAGESNTWTVKDPSKNPALAGSDYKAEVKTQLEANALNARVILEGSSADWNVRVSADTATYTNTRTGTSVTLPADHQARIGYAAGAAFEKFATDTIDGKSVKAPPAGGQPRTGTETRPVEPGAPQGPRPETGATPPTARTDGAKEHGLEDFQQLLTEMLTELMTQELSDLLAQELAQSLTKSMGRKNDPRGFGKLKALLMEKAGLSKDQADKVLKLLGFDERRPVPAKTFHQQIRG